MVSWAGLASVRAEFCIDFALHLVHVGSAT